MQAEWYLALAITLLVIVIAAAVAEITRHD